MAVVVPPPVLDRSLQMALMGFAQPLGQGLAMRGRQQALQQFAQQQGINIPAGLPPGLTQQMIMQSLDPFGMRQAQAGLIGAQTGLVGAQAGLAEAQIGQVGVQPPFTLGPGQQRFGPEGVPVGEPMPFRPPAPRAPIRPTAFQETQAQIDALSAIPKDQRTPTEQARLDQLLGRKPPVPVRGGRQIVEVSPGEYRAQLIDPTTGETIRDFGKPTPRELVGEVAPEALSKPVKAQLEKEIAKIDKSILESETVLSLWKPEFSTLGAQLEAWWTRKRERIKGIPIIGELVPVRPEEKRALAEYSRWRGAAGKKFFAFRKWVTGVAGGQLEMDQIREVFPDEKTKSPTEFAAMYDQMIAFEKAYRRQLVEAIRRGTIITDKVKADIIVDVFSTQAQVQQTGRLTGIPPTGIPPVAEPNTGAVYNKFGF